MSKSIAKKEVFDLTSEIEDKIEEVLNNKESFNSIVDNIDLVIEIEELLYDSLERYEEEVKEGVIEIIDEIVSRLNDENRDESIIHISDEIKDLFIDELEYIEQLINDYDFENAKVHLSEFRDIENKNKRNKRYEIIQEKEKGEAIKIFNLRNQGLTLKEIAKSLSISISTVRRRIKKYE